jgi:hypothetical protein
VQAGGGGLAIVGITVVAQQAKAASGAVRDLVNALHDLDLNLSAGWPLQPSWRPWWFFMLG